jgi:DNA primase
MTDQKLRQLSRTLGLSAASLIRLGLGWDGQAFTFPMRGKRGQVVGIRRRFLSGPKSSVKGSRCGLFIPQGLSGEGPLLICEGPTDTAVSLDLGYNAVGRPNCNSGIQELTDIVRGRDSIIIADSDDVGINGAKRAAKFLMLYCNSLRIFVPPVKDIRQWVSQESDRGYIRHSIENATAIKMNYNLKTGMKL